jgi:membrane associated rhomboid family serine protease
VIDQNHILLFIACVSPLVLLARTRRNLSLHRTWRTAAWVVLAITAVAWILSPGKAGFIGGVAWFFLLLVPAIALRRLRNLIAQQKFMPARRWITAMRVVHPSEDLRELREAIDLRMRGGTEMAYGDAMLLSWLEETAPRSTFVERRGIRRLSPAVTVFISLNLLMFGAEFLLGGTTNGDTLHRLGALEVGPVLARNEYWRLITALFLHFGALHLLFNLYALYVLGPPLEQALGSVRFVICYLFAGIGSTAGVLLLCVIGWSDADQLVGASGCLMGIIGAWAGLLVRHRHLPLATRRLQNVLLVVVVQVVFDLSTPQVSMGAHLFGLGSGFVAGLVLSPREL